MHAIDVRLPPFLDDGFRRVPPVSLHRKLEPAVADVGTFSGARVTLWVHRVVEEVFKPATACWTRGLVRMCTGDVRRWMVSPPVCVSSVAQMHRGGRWTA